MRRTIDLDLGWRFHLGEADNASYMGYDDRAWSDVTLPHDWSVGLPFDISNSSGTGYLPGGVGWYRKHFTLPEDIAGKRVFVTFGGVYKHSRCWINSHYLGSRAYGYSSFTYELTDRVKAGENVLCVRAEHNELADSRWFTGAGIYRDVTLTIVDAIYIEDVFARTVSVADGRAELRATVTHEGGEAKVALLDSDGRTVAEAGEGEPLYVDAPVLWSPESPYLYTLRVTLSGGGVPVDEQTIPFGIRTFRFDANEGFFLNGEPRKLKGVCVHHDAGVLGAAVPACVWEDRIIKLKAAGCNALRSSHNPPDPKLLDLCDRLGLLVIDEAFDEWEGCKNKWWQGHNVYPPKHGGYSEDFPEWHERDLCDMVRRDRNHPCVILWSIGNEIDYPNDPYVHPCFETMLGNNDKNKPLAELVYDPAKPDARRLPVIARELCALVKREDDTRPVTIALAFPELSNVTGLSDTVDVAGYNYKEHMYAGDHEKYPARILMGSENGHTTENWLAVKNNRYVAGQFLWTGVDFLGEAQGWPVRISRAGLLDTSGFEKPLWHYRRALWCDTLCLKLAVSDTGDIWDESFGWCGEAGEKKHVSCYTNAERVTLYINGRALETREIKEDACAAWELPFEAGELRAVCERGDERIEDVLYTPGKAAALLISGKPSALPADGKSIAALRLLLVDSEGRAVTNADELVTVQMLGDAKLMGIENGSPIDLTSFASNTRPTYEGRAVVYVRAGTMKGEVALRVWTRSGLSQTVSIELR